MLFVKIPPDRSDPRFLRVTVRCSEAVEEASSHMNHKKRNLQIHYKPSKQIHYESNSKSNMLVDLRTYTYELSAADPEVAVILVFFQSEKIKNSVRTTTLL